MRRATLALTLTLAALSACSAPMVRAPANGDSACYILAAVDERPLPYLQGEGSAIARHELTEGMLQLREDGTFFMDMTYFTQSPTGPRRTGRFYEGLWVRTAEGIDLQFDNGARDIAEIRDGALFIDMDGVTYRWTL